VGWGWGLRVEGCEISMYVKDINFIDFAFLKRYEKT
jgi:hypothetical protein